MVKNTYKNSEMVLMLQSLKTVLSHRDKIGYVAARNYRVISEALTEYNAFKRDLIAKYGDVEKDEAGRETGIVSISIASPNFKQFSDEMAPINEISQEIELMTAKFEEAIGTLSGEEILQLDWMLVD